MTLKWWELVSLAAAITVVLLLVLVATGAT